MSLQIEHIPSDYYNSKATIGSLFLFIGYMTKPDIHRDKSYIECKTHVKKMFPDVDENSEGIHIGIIGMIALKDGPFYNSHKMQGGSKGGAGFMIAQASQFLLLLYFLILMWSAYKNLETNLISNKLELINISASGVVTSKKVTAVDLFKDPKGVAMALAENLQYDAEQQIIDFTKKATEQVSEVAAKHIDNIRNDFKSTIIQRNDNNDILNTLGQWAGLVQNIHNGLLVENAIDIVSTRTEFAIDELQRKLYHELDNEIAEFKNNVRNSVNKIKYDINTYIRLFTNNGIYVITILLTMSGSAGLQKLTNRNSRNILTNSGGKKNNKKTHKKRKKKRKETRKMNKKKMYKKM